MSDDLLDEKKKKKQQKGKKRARKVAARKKKSSGKKDACYRKVKSRYKVWPSAYASGALVKCRKVGAKNWGNKTKNEEIELEEVDLIPGGLTADLKGSMEEKHKAIADMHNVSLEKINNQIAKGTKIELEHTSDKAIAHEIAMDHVYEDPMYYSKLEKIEGGIVDETQEKTTLDEKRKKRKKAGTESSKEKTLRHWFKRKGAKGSKGGWVDCNAPDGKGGYKSCGRGSGEKRKRYPACRPTPSACKERGRGKSWGKKGSKRRKSRRNEDLLRTLVREETQKAVFGKTISEGLAFHIDNDMPIRDNVYRHGTSRYFSLVNEARGLWKEGKLNLDEEDIDIMESDLGQFGSFAGQQVPLDFPMMIEENLNEETNIFARTEEEIAEQLRYVFDFKKQFDQYFSDSSKIADDSDKKAYNIFKPIRDKIQSEYKKGEETLYDDMINTIMSSGSSGRNVKNQIAIQDQKINAYQEHTAKLIDYEKRVFDQIKEKQIQVPNFMYGTMKNTIDAMLKHWRDALKAAKSHRQKMDSMSEAKKKKKKKDPPIGKPMKNSGGGKKYKVFVRNPKTGKIKKITYGDSKGGLKGNWNNAEARKSFAARHNCKDKKDRTKAGYWACRAHKDFGTNVPGRFW